jgi:AGZA family xanthine/uracil permease-like MFS transporter
VALTFVPAAAAVVLIQLGGVLSALGRSPGDLAGEAATTYRALLVLGNGFILTALLWGSALVFIVERRAAATAAVFAVASLATLGGLIHSPLPSGAVFWPWSADAPLAVAAPLAGAYGVLAGLVILTAAGARAR